LEDAKGVIKSRKYNKKYNG